MELFPGPQLIQLGKNHSKKWIPALLLSDTIAF
jgi:hypothetical protein